MLIKKETDDVFTEYHKLLEWWEREKEREQKRRNKNAQQNKQDRKRNR